MSFIPVALSTALMSILPKALEVGFNKLLGVQEEPKKQDRTRYTPQQMQTILAMWEAWQANPCLYKTQDEFADLVNQKFSTNKSKKTIINYIKKVKKPV
jgi:hypothetical protein